ncbi:MAG: FkbM family methyltransferase [Caulobacteraceae bacterium]|nr:FkbM family methyltransferase [Caulobacter sp.]
MSGYELHLGGKPVDTAALRLYSHFGFADSELPLLDRFVDPQARGEPGFVTEPFGVRTRVANLWPEIAPFDGALWGLPVPGNWHWDASEWLAIARSVLQAQGRYRVMELGAGWGPACVGGAVMARFHGLGDIAITAVEADPHHFGFLRQHLLDNGFDPDAHLLMEAAVGVRDGHTRFPEFEGDATTYGARPLDADGDYLGRPAVRTRRVRLVSFRRLLRREPVWDLVHIDVQGGEMDICRSARRELSARVARVCLGTHSRKLDGDLYDLFWRRGWVLENEKPTRMEWKPGAKSQEAMNVHDGLQVWRNPALRPGPAG